MGTKERVKTILRGGRGDNEGKSTKEGLYYFL